jgi:hypothetical protein
MTEQGHRHFHRIALTSPATLWDFQSAKARGAPEPADPTRRAVWDGVSVYSTMAQARRKQRMSPQLGKYIAVLRVPTDGSVRFMRTLGGDGHHTIWGEPSALLGLVVSVEPA